MQCSVVVVIVVFVVIIVVVVVVVVVVVEAVAVAVAVAVVAAAAAVGDVVVVVVDIEAPSNHQKVAQNTQALTLLTSKCGSHHNGVHFRHIESASNRKKMVRTQVLLTF